MARPVDVILGAPGAGKTEQANRLATSSRYVHLSTGQLLRAVADPALQKLLAEGKLAPTDQVEALLFTRLQEINPDLPVLLDGFPRTKDEAEWLETALAKFERQLGKVIFINLAKDEAAARLVKRGRSDDVPATIDQRWQEYEHQTEPVIKYFRHHDLLIEIDGSGTPEEVADRISAAL